MIDRCCCDRCEGREDGLWRDDDAYALRRPALAPSTLPARPCACCGQPVLEDGSCTCGYAPGQLLGPHLLACPAALPF